jgi:hypothetical protein
MSEPLTPVEANEDEWITRPKGDGIAVTLTRKQWREREEEENGERPSRKRSVRGRDFITY